MVKKNINKAEWWWFNTSVFDELAIKVKWQSEDSTKIIITLKNRSTVIDAPSKEELEFITRIRAAKGAVSAEDAERAAEIEESYEI